MAATSTTTTSCLLHKLNPPARGRSTPAEARAMSSDRRSSIILTAVLLISAKPAAAFDFRMTVPDQTLEEAESGIPPHAQGLLRVKDLLVAESWKEAQKLLRKTSSLLKQDIYIVIQAKPAADRPRLRKLFSELFNGVSKLDYAARDKDRIRVWEYYDAVVISLDRILSQL